MGLSKLHRETLTFIATAIRTDRETIAVQVGTLGDSWKRIDVINACYALEDWKLIAADAIGRNPIYTATDKGRARVDGATPRK